MQYTIDENGIHYYDLFAGDSAVAPASGDDDAHSVIDDAEAVAKVKQIAKEISDALCECRASGATTLCGGCE